MAEIIPLQHTPKRVNASCADVLPNGAAVSVAAWLRVWRSRIVLRRMLREELLTAPDCILADAGWTRSDAAHEAGKPFWRA
ncbi:MAG: hypothetical protein AAFY31_05015 [Pseudomonadota bacterium]